MISAPLGSKASLFEYNQIDDTATAGRIVNGTLVIYTFDPSAGSGQAVGLALPEVLVAYESAGTVWYLHLTGVIATDAGTAWTDSAAT